VDKLVKMCIPEDAEIDVDKLVEMCSTNGLVTCRQTPYSMDIGGGLAGVSIV